MFVRKQQLEEVKISYEKEIESLKRENQVLNAIKNSIPDAYYVRDMEYNVIMWPEEIQKLTGFTEEEAKNIKCSKIFKAEVCKDCPTQKCISSKKFLKDAVTDIISKNGTKIAVLVSNYGIYDESGNPLGAVEVVKDYSKYTHTLKTLGVNTEQLSAISEELAAASEEVTDMANNLNSQATEVSNLTIKGLEEAKVVTCKAQECSNYAEGVMSSVNEVDKSMEYSIKEMTNLKQKSEGIKNVINAIQDIASQTNLLALNASIEAARAGDQGKGFAVVAEEVRKLAESSNLFSNEIKETIDVIINLINVTTQSIEDTDKDLKNGEVRINEMIKLINNITHSSNVLNSTIKDIQVSASETSEISHRQTSSIEEVSNVAQEIASIAQKTQNDFSEELSTLKYKNM